MITLLYSGYYDMDTAKHPFEVDPNFFYLTNCDLPNILVLKKGHKYYINTVIPTSIWYDKNYFIKALKQCFNATLVTLNDIIKMTKSIKQVYTLPNIKSHPQWSKLKPIHMNITNIDQTLTIKREIKSIYEQQCIERACKYTSGGIKDIIKQSYPGMSQIELSGIFKQSISTYGIQELSFNPITAHGIYNQYLHYIAKDIVIPHGSMVLLDVGCKYKNYCSDISRCFPISGKFSILQKNIYNIVLKSLKYALKLMIPGIHWSHITKQVKIKIYDECLKINLVHKLDNETDKLNIISLLMPHMLGHHVGLDTHDGYHITKLKKDMVIAIEPGIYFQNNIKSPYINNKEWNKYKHIGGIRLEDTILITDTGYKNLSNVTKEIDGIENIMK